MLTTLKEKSDFKKAIVKIIEENIYVIQGKVIEVDESNFTCSVEISGLINLTRQSKKGRGF